MLEPKNRIALQGWQFIINNGGRVLDGFVNNFPGCVLLSLLSTIVVTLGQFSVNFSGKNSRDNPLLLESWKDDAARRRR